MNDIGQNSIGLDGSTKTKPASIAAETTTPREAARQEAKHRHRDHEG